MNVLDQKKEMCLSFDTPPSSGLKRITGTDSSCILPEEHATKQSPIRKTIEKRYNIGLFCYELTLRPPKTLETNAITIYCRCIFTVFFKISGDTILFFRYIFIPSPYFLFGPGRQNKKQGYSYQNE